MTNPRKYCKVKGCRFANYHTTVAHRCGSCNQYGHGQIECNSDTLKRPLIQFLEDSMPNHRCCEFSNCTYPWSHSSESHHCFLCGERGTHSAQQCPINHPQEGGASNQEEPINTVQMTRLQESRSATKEPDTVDSMNIQQPTSVIFKQCPMCRQHSNVDLNLKVFTDAPCPICMEMNTKIIFSGCKHANVCHKFVSRL